MKTLIVKLNTASIIHSSSGMTLAEICLHVGDNRFPNEGWVDLAVIILSSWNRALITLLKDGRQPVEIRFMEGPFVVEITRVSATIWRADFFESGLEKKLLYKHEVDAEAFVRSVLDACDQLLGDSRTGDPLLSSLKDLTITTDQLRTCARSLLINKRMK